MLHVALDRAALAGGVAAFEQHDDLLAALLDPALRLEQLLLQFQHVLFIGRGAQARGIGIFAGLEHPADRGRVVPHLREMMMRRESGCADLALSAAFFVEALFSGCGSAASEGSGDRRRRRGVCGGVRRLGRSGGFGFFGFLVQARFPHEARGAGEVANRQKPARARRVGSCCHTIAIKRLAP